MNNIFRFLLFILFVQIPVSNAWDIAFADKSPSLPKQSKLYVGAGVNPGVPLVFDASDQKQVTLRPARKDEHTRGNHFSYVFEWEDNNTAMFYSMYDRKLIDKLSIANLKDISSPSDRQYEVETVETFLQNGQLVKKCVPSKYVGQITAYLVIDVTGEAKQIYVMPEGSISKCIRESGYQNKYRAPSRQFVVKANIEIGDIRSTKQEPKCYMPYAASKDHMVTGCEISGYHMRYDLAKASGAFMILLPNDSLSLEEASHYFSIQTLSFDDGGLQELFDNDMKNIISEKPDTIKIRKLNFKFPNENACLGAEMKYSTKLAAFSNEIFYICNSGSNKYAILLSVGARTKRDLDAATPKFIDWMKVPQLVKDMKIYD